MLKRELWLCLLLVLLLNLASCGPRPLSPQAYQDLVIKTLQGEGAEKDRPPLPGLVLSIKTLFNSLYCAEYNCGMASEMQYLAEVAQDQRDAIDLQRGKICSKKVRPPQGLGKDHERLCSLLGDIRHDMDTIGLTATYAAQAASNYSDSSEAQEATKGFSRKILEFKEQILKSLQELRELEWLRPIFIGVEEQIPELRATVSGASRGMI